MIWAVMGIKIFENFVPLEWKITGGGWVYLMECHQYIIYLRCGKTKRKKIQLLQKQKISHEREEKQKNFHKKLKVTIQENFLQFLI